MLIIFISFLFTEIIIIFTLKVRKSDVYPGKENEIYLNVNSSTQRAWTNFMMTS